MMRHVLQTTPNALHMELQKEGVLLNTPLSFRWIAIILLFLVALIIVFICVAEFSQKFMVQGYLNSDRGLIHVYPNKHGIIVQQQVRQGQHVKQGDALFVIDTSYDGFYTTNAAALQRKLQSKRALINQELILKEKHLLALKTLLDKKFISEQDYEQKKAELLGLKRDKKQIEMELIQHQQANIYKVRAPIDGLVSSMLYHEGQSTLANKPLLTILPAKSKLTVELFVPVRQAGFIHTNSSVIIRYDTYPYQRFGAAQATITSMGQSIITDQEDDKPIKIKEPYYKMIAKLDKPSIQIYGKTKPLRQGMTITAIILGERKTLWRWILDPLFSYSGQLWR